jgi:uroporphyrinogen-III decarboxylase
MSGEMTKTERVMAALKGEPVDHVPVSAWWHEWDREWSAADVAAATLTRTAVRVVIKVNPRFVLR